MKFYQNITSFTEKTDYFDRIVSLFFLSLAGGLFMIADEILGLPPTATAKGLRLASKSEQSIADTLLNMLVMPVVNLRHRFFYYCSF